VSEIAAASQEQSAGIEQVNKAVMQLDELTQQNAALVEEASAASQSMADQARALNETMARYKVDNSVSEVRTPARAPNVAAAHIPERRAPARPWSGTSAPVKPAPRKAGINAGSAATGTNDTVWKEF
jgi:hypothetical protein